MKLKRSFRKEHIPAKALELEIPPVYPLR